MMGKCEGRETGYEARLRQCRARICNCCACIGREQSLRTSVRKSRRQRRRKSWSCWWRMRRSFGVAAADMKEVVDKENRLRVPGGGSGSSLACSGRAGSRCRSGRMLTYSGRAHICSCPACSGRAGSRRTAARRHLSRTRIWNRKRRRRRMMRTARCTQSRRRCPQRTGRSRRSRQQERRTRPPRHRNRREHLRIQTVASTNLLHRIPRSPSLRLRLRRNRSCLALSHRAHCHNGPLMRAGQRSHERPRACRWSDVLEATGCGRGGERKSGGNGSTR
jgi:hypothetical protein